MAHPLHYFTDDPFQRDDGDDLCSACSSPAGKGREAHATGKYSITGEVRRVGVLAGFSLWDVLYRVRGNIYPVQSNGTLQGKIAWKSILVQTGLDRYIEIYHLQSTASRDLTPTRIVRSGAESVLVTEDSDGGNGGGCWEGYWSFDRSGPHRINFSSLRPVIASHLPAGAIFSTICSEVNLEKQEIRSWVRKAHAECRACGGLGEVTAHFRLHGARVEATDVNFDRDPQ